MLTSTMNGPGPFHGGKQPSKRSPSHGSFSHPRSSTTYGQDTVIGYRQDDGHDDDGTRSDQSWVDTTETARRPQDAARDQGPSRESDDDDAMVTRDMLENLHSSMRKSFTRSQDRQKLLSLRVDSLRLGQTGLSDQLAEMEIAISGANQSLLTRVDKLTDAVNWLTALSAVDALRPSQDTTDRRPGTSSCCSHHHGGGGHELDLLDILTFSRPHSGSNIFPSPGQATNASQSATVSF
ncbi:hypothetical protein BD324DRAFT_378267 [Kockovaella imperatae]|uniref:Uncharacterized protein n=1 Tax=Kockovaella imperatae TaxID=4999 RepID=A0A1Y1UMJ7_9TREE|nr:hypothetical protein BD324DRAFT_378267 [Kockovaella imperatae]ORX38714.1 hypothetical protein BD324DRAFT_378267 [Kockovaella imperatae]